MYDSDRAKLEQTGLEEVSPWLLSRRGNFDELVGPVEDYAIFMMSDKGIVLDWNLGAQELKGYRSDEIVGKHFARFYSEGEAAAGVPEEELEVAAGHGRFVTEGWRYRKDGSRFWASVTITALRSAGGQLEGFLKITRDLTERQEQVEALRQSEERFRLLIESVSDYAIFLLDEEGRVRSWNPGAHRIKGYDEREILGEHFSRFYTPEALAAGLPSQLLQRALREGSAEDEGWRVRKDGTRFWGNVLITAVYDDGGNHRGFVKITRDLTARRAAEHMAIASRRKDTFLATLAHELRNPLAPMLPGLDVLLKAPHDAGRVVQVSSMLRRQVDQMGRLIEDLVDLSRITTGKIALKRTAVTLADLIERAVEAARPAMEKKKHHFTLKLPSVGVNLEVDDHRVVQAITNLLMNAMKYTPEGGAIVLEACNGNGMLSVKIRDTGVGIAPHLQDTIFDLFDQGDNSGEDGLGIGLTLVRTIAELHGGTVTAHSAGVGSGSEFVLELPVVVGPVAQETTAISPVVSLDPLRKRCRVLIADDGKNTADILAVFFDLEGFETAVAYDGRQAVETAESFRPDIVCLDLGMPVMDGYAAAAELRRMFPGILLVALTGWGADADRKRTTEAGFDTHLVKPVKPENLRQIIRERLPHC